MIKLATTTTNTKTDLLALTLPQLQQWLMERGEPAFRAKQLYHWLYQQLVTDFSAMTNLPQALRTRLAEEACGQWTAQFNPRTLTTEDFRGLYARALA